MPLTGVSYVVIKVTRGFTEGAREERREMLEQQRERLETMLRKYGAGDNVAQSSTTAVANDKAKVLKT